MTRASRDPRVAITVVLVSLLLLGGVTVKRGPGGGGGGETLLFFEVTENVPNADPECFWFTDESTLWVSCGANGAGLVFDRATELTRWSLSVGEGLSHTFQDGGGEGCDAELLDDSGTVLSSTTVGDSAGVLEANNATHTVEPATPLSFEAGDTVRLRLSPATGDDCVTGDGSAVSFVLTIRLYGTYP